MFRLTPARVLASAAVLVVMLTLWAEVSALWVRLGTAVVATLSRGPSAPVPPGASILLPIVCAGLVALDLPLPRRLFWVAVAFAVTFGLELALIALWAVIGVAPSAVVVPGDAVQVLVPIGVVALGFSESRRRSRYS